MKKTEQNAQGSPGNGSDIYSFSLYVTGASVNSSKAINNLKAIFEKYLPNRYELQVIDVYQQPQIAQTVDIIALPMLVRVFPLPQRRLIGNMSDKQKIVANLGLEH